MPEIVRLTNCKICVYAGDHAPPHFHVFGPNSNASIDIATLELMKGRIHRNDRDEAIAWASDPANLARLMAEWKRLNERN